MWATDVPSLGHSTGVPAPDVGPAPEPIGLADEPDPATQAHASVRRLRTRRTRHAEADAYSGRHQEYAE